MRMRSNRRAAHRTSAPIIVRLSCPASCQERRGGRRRISPSPSSSSPSSSACSGRATCPASRSGWRDGGLDRPRRHRACSSSPCWPSSAFERADACRRRPARGHGRFRRPDPPFVARQRRRRRHGCREARRARRTDPRHRRVPRLAGAAGDAARRRRRLHVRGRRLGRSRVRRRRRRSPRLLRGRARSRRARHAGARGRARRGCMRERAAPVRSRSPGSSPGSWASCSARRSRACSGSILQPQ